MLKTLLICTALSAGLCGCASPGTPTASAQPVSSNCMISGTRIVQKGSECSSYPGRSFSQEDLDRTGDENAGDALQKLDPSITVQHH